MTRKRQLKREIDDLEREIAALEQKRERSQSSLMRSMLSGKKPNPEDKRYFDVFSSLIDEARDKLRRLLRELDDLQD